MQRIANWLLTELREHMLLSTALECATAVYLTHWTVEQLVAAGDRWLAALLASEGAL